MSLKINGHNHLLINSQNKRKYYPINADNNKKSYLWRDNNSEPMG